MHDVTAHGARIPAIGLGTFRLKDDHARQMVEHAIRHGYRHVDTAQMYGNEAEVGDGIAASKVPRDSLFVTTKVWPDNFADGALQKSVEESLKKLRLQAVDLVLLHWPRFDRPLKETIKALNQVKQRGLARHIGVSNFNVALLREAWSLTDAPLVCNQVEYHPYLDQSPVLNEVRARGMALTAYQPLSLGKVFEDAVLIDIAKRHGKTPGQVTLRWLIDQGQVAAIPKTGTPARAEENLALDFSLTPQERQAITALHRPDGRNLNPASLAPAWDKP
jgi:2,5-diketo-D-gluconate reductase B